MLFDKTMSEEIRVIPISGKALQYEPTASARSVFPISERGFMIGSENFPLEPIFHSIFQDKLDRRQLPVLLYGPSGCGKTHLLSGLPDALRKHHSPNRSESGSRRYSRQRVLYLSAVDFARHYSEALDTRTVDDFRKRFRNASLLLLDDVDLISGKPWALEELRSTLDESTVDGGLVVLSAKKYPAADTYPESLCARLVGGTVLPILPPGLAVRIRFLGELASAFHLALSEAALEKAAAKLPFHLPKLYGIFSRMVFEATAESRKIDNACLLDSVRRSAGEDQPDMSVLARKTARHFALKLTDLRGKSRNQSVSLARSVAVYLIRERTPLSLKEIAAYFGNRDLSTIRHLIRRVRDELPNDPILRDHVSKIDESD